MQIVEIPLSESDLVLIQDQIESEQFFNAHKGHERAHQTIAILFVAVLLSSQLAITAWKRYHPRSCTLFSQTGLWLFPFLIGLRARNYTYVSVWVAFTLANLVVFRRAYEKPFNPATPGLVYAWYAGVYSLSYAVGTVGYVLVFLAIFRVPEAVLGISDLSDARIFATGIITVFYGLYFGTLGRDFVMRLSDQMARSVGYFNPVGFPLRHLREQICAVCGEATDEQKQTSKTLRQSVLSILSIVVFQGGKLTSNKAVQLECKHIYHESCIRGWLLIGKKDICPYCKERVDMKQFTGTNPWETTQHLYLSIIDALRYILVWNPVVFFLVHYLLIILGLH